MARVRPAPDGLPPVTVGRGPVPRQAVAADPATPADPAAPADAARVAPARERPASDALRVAGDVVGLVVAPVAVVSALLYYFGWVRTGALFATFGIDQQILGYSPQDYVLRSAGVAFRPAAWGLLGAAAALGAVAVLREVTRRYPHRARPVLVAVAGAGGVLLGWSVGTLLGVVPATRPLAAALGLAAGALLVNLAAARWPGRRAAGGTLPARRFLLAGALLLAAFWACAVYAQRSGEALAAAFAAAPALRPAVVVYSDEDLHLSGPSISHEVLEAEGQARHRYSGLRLLIYSDERWFLIPERWAADGTTSSIVLADEGLRVELAPPGRPATAP